MKTLLKIITNSFWAIRYDFLKLLTFITVVGLIAKNPTMSYIELVIRCLVISILLIIIIVSTIITINYKELKTRYK